MNLNGFVEIYHVYRKYLDTIIFGLKPFSFWILIGTLANSEDPDEMLHKVATKTD